VKTNRSSSRLHETRSTGISRIKDANNTSAPKFVGGHREPYPKI